MVIKKALIIANSLGFISNFLRVDISLLKSMGYSITVAGSIKSLLDDTLDYFQKNDLTPIDVQFTSRSLELGSLITSYSEIKKILKSNHFDLIHCHTPIVATLVRVVARKYRKTGTKVIYTSHGFPFYEGAKGIKPIIFKTVESYCSWFTDGIITICNEDYTNAKKMHCNSVYKINGVGIELNQFSIPNFDRFQYRKMLGFCPDDIVILSIGELNTNKNHQVVIKAISEINDKRIKYAICGKELTELGKKEELIKLADSLNVDLRLLGFRKDIPMVCLSSDIGAIPSFKEGLGLSGLEMLASGMPVVGSNRQGIKDYVIEGQTGYLANPELSGTFAEAIVRTIEMGNVAETCRKVASDYSIEKTRKAMLEIYNTILNYSLY